MSLKQERWPYTRKSGPEQGNVILNQEKVVLKKKKTDPKTRKTALKQIKWVPEPGAQCVRDGICRAVAPGVTLQSHSPAGNIWPDVLGMSLGVRHTKIN